MPRPGGNPLVDQITAEAMQQVNALVSPRHMYRDDATSTSGSTNPYVTPERTYRKKDKIAAAMGVQPNTGADGTLEETWPADLPRPPSAKVEIEEKWNPNAPTVCVFNVNSREGSAMVKVLSESGINVVGVVRNYTSPIAKQLIKLKYVKVKVASWMDKQSLLQASEGCQKAYFVTKYWEKFESNIEEQIATNILVAAAEAGIKRMVLATFESAIELKNKRLRSELMPDKTGRILPKFKGMKRIHSKARELRVELTNVMTSFYDADDMKKAMVLVRPPNGKIMVETCTPDGV